MEELFLNKLDPRSLIRDILRQWWTILLLSISVGLLTQVWLTLRFVPQYTTSTTFVVADRANAARTYRNLETASKTAERFAFVLEGQLLQKAVCQDLELPSFAARTKVEQVKGTNMIEMSVTAGSPELSFRIMRSIMDNYKQVSDFVVGSVDLEVLQDPMVPSAPSNYTNHRGPIHRNALIAFVLLCLLAGFASMQRNTVKNMEQFKTSIDAYPCGAVWHERKSNRKIVSRLGTLLVAFFELLPFRLGRPRKDISMLVDNPMRSFPYVEANRMVANRVRSRMDRKGAKVALVTSVFENEGKSTVAANLALSMAMDGKRVLLVDVDLRRPSQYKIFQLAEENCVDLVEIMNAPALREQPAKRYKDTSLYIIANNHSIKGSDKSVSMRKLKILIDHYREKMDYIILDTSPMALVTDTEMMTALADGSILVVREDVVPVAQINDTIDVLNSYSKVLGGVFNDAHQALWNDSLQNKSYRGYYGRE